MSLLRRYVLPVGCFAGGVASGMFLQQQQQQQQPSALAPAKTDASSAAKTPYDAPVDLFDAVGNTPLIELKSLSKLTNCKIYAKAEYMNPCGSVKDRAAKFLILDAEESGAIKAGDTIVEATGGNTGVSLALLAAARGYKTMFTMPEKTAREKIELMKVMGAQVFVQPMASMFDKENHFYHVAQRLSKTIENAVYPNQFENTANMKAHYMTTGPEIWRQTNGTIDGFVTSSGTAGTISGISKFLKEKKPECAVWIVDPEEVAGISKFVNDDRTTSSMKDGFEVIQAKQGSTIAEGVGLSRVTPNFREAKVDKGITATNQEVVDMAYFLLRNDGIFVGPSAALNALGAVKMARELGPGSTVVTILCDGGDRYRSKLYNPAWLKEQDLLPSTGEGRGDSLTFVHTIKLP
uniref:Cysteine synthase n=1 Tax=Globisporangium ultimum (strain ATCC 200006 / CBS 805.95 / DAOM BR144) TaxID=431595 RepID=K3XBS8_GLOUD